MLSWKLIRFACGIHVAHFLNNSHWNNVSWEPRGVHWAYSDLKHEFILMYQPSINMCLNSDPHSNHEIWFKQSILDSCHTPQVSAAVFVATRLRYQSLKYAMWPCTHIYAFVNLRSWFTSNKSKNQINFHNFCRCLKRVVSLSLQEVTLFLEYLEAANLYRE